MFTPAAASEAPAEIAAVGSPELAVGRADGLRATALDVPVTHGPGGMGRGAGGRLSSRRRADSALAEKILTLRS